MDKQEKEDDKHASAFPYSCLVSLFGYLWLGVVILIVGSFFWWVLRMICWLFRIPL